jgi:AcrR family transcriptional regulator
MAHRAADLDERKILVARAVHRTILSQGLEGVNLRDISRELGVTTGFLTHYFRNKAELLLFAKDLLMKDLMSGARAAAEGATGWERLRIVCEHLLPLTAERVDTWLVFFAFLGRAIGDRKLMNVQIARYRASQKFYEAEIQHLVATGHLASSVDVEKEGLALASFVDGLVSNALFSPTRDQHDLQRNLLARYIDRALRPQGPPTASVRRKTK